MIFPTCNKHETHQAFNLYFHNHKLVKFVLHPCQPCCFQGSIFIFSPTPPLLFLCLILSFSPLADHPLLSLQILCPPSLSPHHASVNMKKSHSVIQRKIILQYMNAECCSVSGGCCKHIFSASQINSEVFRSMSHLSAIQLKCMHIQGLMIRVSLPVLLCPYFIFNLSLLSFTSHQCSPLSFRLPSSSSRRSPEVAVSCPPPPHLAHPLSSCLVCFHCSCHELISLTPSNTPSLTSPYIFLLLVTSRHHREREGSQLPAELRRLQGRDSQR